MASYIPATDAGANAWALNFDTVLTAAPTDYNLVAGDATAVHTLRLAYTTALVLATDPGTRTPATIAAKDGAKTAMLAGLRPYAVGISADPTIDPGLKAAIGVTVRTTTRTPVAAPTTSPALTLDSIQPGILNVSYKDISTPDSKAKPPGVIGLQLYVAFGTVAAVDPSQGEYVGSFTKSPLQLDTTSHAGKVATLFGRWQTRSGTAGNSFVGPWSAPLVATAA